MSEEDKQMKKKKIEQNRVKRKLKVQPEEAKIIKKIKEECSPSSTSSDCSDDQEVSLERFQITSDSSVTQIVNAITEIPHEASQIIQRVMSTQGEALSLMSRIIQEPSQALALVSHLIKFPSDGMLIISKIMPQSPMEALSVFAQFLSSPTHALQIIFKIMSSPNEVLKFMTELTKSPQNALEIMNQFMPDSLETIQNVNKLINPNKSADAENETIKSMLDTSSVDSPNSVASPQSAPSTIDSYLESDSNNNDYQQMTATILREIAYDLTGKETPAKKNSIDQIINEAIKLEYTTPQYAQMCNASHELNEVELMKIQELLDANHMLQTPIEEDHLSFLGFFGEDSPIKVCFN
jgi:nuclear receptor subfamily 1 group I